MLQSATSEGLLIGGVRRSDSLEHPAIYGSYKAVQMQRKRILHVELVQSNEFKSSYHKELEWIQLLIKLFDRFYVRARALVTNRPRQIAAWLKKNLQDVKRYFHLKGKERILTRL